MSEESVSIPQKIATEVEVDDVGVNTSPGQLQDVTMDHTYAICAPCVSIQHAGSTSPGQGRSIREFEEQMASLRKENFNLKLRIYFLEEKLPGRSSSNADGHDNLMKKNIDLQVDIEVLRKELHEKQSLLCEAAKAMELMEEQQKATEEKNKEIFEELNQKINFLEIENKQLERSTNQSQMNKIMGMSDVNGDIDTIQKIRELEGCVKQYSENTEELNVKINEMEDMIIQKDIKIKEFEEKIKALMFQNAELQEQLDIKDKEISNAEYSRLREEVYDYKVQLADKACILEEMESKLKEKTAAYENACKVIKNFTLHSQDLQQQIDNLKKQNSLGNSMQIKEDTYGNHSTALCKSFTDSLEIGGAIKDELEEIIEEKNYEVNQLNMEIKENRSNLQNLINKEIRQKLCQIENLSKLLSLLTSSVSSAPTSPMRTVDELQQCFTEFDLNVAIDRNTFLQKKINDQTQQLFSELELKKANELTADQLNTKINEAEMSHRWSREACVILTARLEELAGFLDSLLKHKDVLGALGADRSREMRKAIDKSLDFSRSLNNMSLNMTGVSMTEQSLAQLTNITGLFDMTVDKENLSFTENKVTEQIQLIENLQTEIKTLKKELSHRKVSGESLKKERRSLPPFFENRSESETWSEPDRSVSLARMGLEKSPGFNRTKGSEVEQLSTSTGSDTDRKGKSKSREKISKLEKLIADKDDRLLEIQCQLVEADNRLKQEGLRVRDAIEELEEYKKMNDILEAELNDYRSKAHHFGGNLEIENESLKRAVDEKTAFIEKIQEEREKLKIDTRIAEMKIENLTRNIKELEANHQENLEKVSEQEKLKFGQLHKELLVQLEQKLREQEEKHREYLARDWISRVVYDDMKSDMEAMQKKYNEAQNTIEYLQENEVELNQRLIENEKALRNLKKSLDDTTLQASKAILDRTKCSREKVHFESRVQDLIQKLEDIEKEKLNLELKVAQLEKSNSELIQRTLLSNNQGEFKHLNKPSSHGSDVSQSGYTSEDVPMPSTQKGGVQRAQNSSPDLGIESDAGRASSVELAGAPRLLKSIENLESRENVLEKETWKIQDKTNDRNERDTTTNSGPIIHDCAKVEQENIELRRKLARTKRAFENTAVKLQTSNKIKEQVERDIRQQILKTHTVLRNVRSNMDNLSQ